jgi:hypothetical protein
MLGLQAVQKSNDVCVHMHEAAKRSVFISFRLETVLKFAQMVTAISHFQIEQRTGSSRLFGGTKNKQYAEYGI